MVAGGSVVVPGRLVVSAAGSVEPTDSLVGAAASVVGVADVATVVTEVSAPGTPAEHGGVHRRERVRVLVVGQGQPDQDEGPRDRQSSHDLAQTHGR